MESYVSASNNVYMMFPWLQWGRSPGKNRDKELDIGFITYGQNGSRVNIAFHAKDTDVKVPPAIGDLVSILLSLPCSVKLVLNKKHNNFVTN